MSKNSIPSEEDFARARSAMRDRDRGLSEVRDRILSRFEKNGLHEAFVFFSPAKELFVVHLFYLRSEQVQEASESGLESQIKEVVVEELTRVGRTTEKATNVEFHFVNRPGFSGDSVV